MPTFVDPAKPFYIEIEQSELTTLRARVARLEEALTPNAETKAAYMCEFSFKETYFDEDGEEQVQKVMIPWTAIKCIVKAIARRALEEK